MKIAKLEQIQEVGSIFVRSPHLRPFPRSGKSGVCLLSRNGSEGRSEGWASSSGLREVHGILLPVLSIVYHSIALACRIGVARISSRLAERGANAVVAVARDCPIHAAAPCRLSHCSSIISTQTIVP